VLQNRCAAQSRVRTVERVRKIIQIIRTGVTVRQTSPEMNVKPVSTHSTQLL